MSEGAPVALPPLPDVGGKRFVLRSAAGAQATLGGLWFTLRRAELRWLALATILTNLLVFAGLLVGGLIAVPFVVDLFGIESRLWWWVVTISIGLGWVVASVLLALVLAGIVAGPFLDKLSERTERIVTGTVAQGPNAIVGAASAIKEAIFQLCLVVPVAALLFLIGLIPVAGAVISLVLGWAWSSLWVSLTFVSPATCRHGLSARQRLGFIFGNKFLFLGFGGIQALVPFLLVPLFAPALVVAGTRIYLQLAAHDRVDSRLSPEVKAALVASEG